jgi:hypothetical protein
MMLHNYNISVQTNLLKPIYRSTMRLCEFFKNFLIGNKPLSMCVPIQRPVKNVRLSRNSSLVVLAHSRIDARARINSNKRKDTCSGLHDPRTHDMYRKGNQCTLPATISRNLWANLTHDYEKRAVQPTRARRSLEIIMSVRSHHNSVIVMYHRQIHISTNFSKCLSRV